MKNDLHSEKSKLISNEVSHFTDHIIYYLKKETLLRCGEICIYFTGMSASWHILSGKANLVY